MKSNTGKAIGNALKNQAIDTAKNLAADVLSGNPLKEGVKREVHNIKNRAALGIQQFRKLFVENQRDKVNLKVGEKQK